MKKKITSGFQRTHDFLNWLVLGRRVSNERFKVRIMKSNSGFDWYHDVIGYIVEVTLSFKGLYEVVTNNDLRLFISKNDCRKATAHEIRYFKVLPF